MKYLLFLLALPLCAQKAAWSDISLATQGVGYRATITVTQFCVAGDSRSPCVTGTKAVLWREEQGIQTLSNPFQSQMNGFFQFFADAGEYDILVSGLGVTTYSYRVQLNNGTFSLFGPAGGDLCGFYPNPIVCGLRGRALPPAAPTQDGVVPTYNLATNQWIWNKPVLILGPGQIDVSGTYPNLTVVGIWQRHIINTTPPVDGNTLVYHSGGTPGWYYETPNPVAASTNTITFNLCIGVECQVSSNNTNPYIVTSATSTISKCFISARVPPTTQNLIVDVLKNGSSIFASGNANKMNLTPSGGAESKTVTSSAVEADLYTASIIQTGVGFGGQDVTVSCKAVFN